MANSRKKDLELVVRQGKPSLVAPDKETPHGHYFLSNLDQYLDLNIRAIVHTLYFYKSEERGNEAAAKVLKEALAKVLVYYYWLAGRLFLTPDGKQVVNCTGEGMLWIEAEAAHPLEMIGDVISPDVPSLKSLFYEIPGAQTIMDYPCAVAQVTKFECGGFTLGLSVCHCFVDGVAWVDFLKSWYETARDVPISTPPFLDRTLLRARNPPQINHPHHEVAEMEDISPELARHHTEVLFASYIFDQQALSRLKQEAMQDKTLDGHCTSFEALTAFVWRARTKALHFHPRQQLKLLFSVDGRNRFQPPLPRGYSGNGVVVTFALCTVWELTESPLGFAVGLVREATRRITDDYMRSSIDLFEEKRQKPSLTATFLVTSWAKLDLRSLDFGWGKPVQNGPVGTPVMKEVCLFLAHGEDGRGINVRLGLPIDAVQPFKDLINTYV